MTSASEEPTAYETLLQRMVEEGIDPEGERAPVLSQSPDERDRLVQARRLMVALDEAGSVELEDLDEASRVRGAPGEERVLSIVREQMALAQARAHAGGRPWWIGLAAAAALLLGFFLLDRGGEAELPGETVLGGRIEFVAPAQTGAAPSTFEWGYDLATNGWFEVRVMDARDGSEVARSGKLFTGRWEPSDAEREAWPADVTWEVLVYDGTGRFDFSEAAPRP